MNEWKRQTAAVRDGKTGAVFPPRRAGALLIAGGALAVAIGGGARAQAQTNAAVPQTTRAAPGTKRDAAAPILRGGTITLKVDDFEAARRKIVAAAEAQGATLADARVEVNDKGRRHGWIRLAIPADQLGALLADVRASGKLYSENITTNNRASEYEDLGRRVIRLREHQTRLSALLKNGRKLRGSDILYVQERLFRAGVDEGMLQQRQTDLSRASQGSSVVVALFEPIPVSASAQARVNLAHWWATGCERASWSLKRNLARGATASAYALVWSPLWLPTLVVALFLLRFVAARWRRSEASAQTAALALATGMALTALARRIAAFLAAIAARHAAPSFGTNAAPSTTAQDVAPPPRFDNATTTHAPGTASEQPANSSPLAPAA